MQSGEEQGEGLAETWAGAGSWGPLWLQPWLHWGPHGSWGGEGRPKVSDDKLKSVHHQHPTTWPGCWETGKSLSGLLGSLNALDGCSWSKYNGLRCFPFTTTKRCSPTDLFYCELERTLMFFTPSQLKGEYRSCPLASTFPSTVISQKIQSAGLVSQPLICLLPHIPAFSPTDAFIPPLHVHLQGKAWSPRPGAPAFSHICPHSHHRHAPGLPALVPAGFLPVATGRPWQPGSFSLWCHGSRNYSQPHLLRVSHLHTPTASPLPSALWPSLPVSSSGPGNLLSVLGENHCLSPARLSPNTILCPVRWPPCFPHRLLIHKAPSPFFPGTQLHEVSQLPMNLG